MTHNCYIVAARPNSPDRYKDLLKNLKYLRKVTNDTIIVSVNSYPYGIENYKDELYDYLVYSDSNEIYHNEEGDFSYAINNEKFSWVTTYKGKDAIDYGRAVNNLYLRGAQLGQSLGKSTFCFMNYDISILDKSFISYLDSTPNLFIEGAPSAIGYPIFETWFFKLDLPLLKMLEFFSLEKNYLNSMVLDEVSLGFYEVLVKNYVRDNNLNPKVISKQEVKKFNVEFDNNFFQFRCALHEGNVILLVEYMSSNDPRYVVIEYNGKTEDYGNCQGWWHLIDLGPYSPELSYVATVNGERHHVKITKEELNKNQLKYHN